MHPPRLFGLYGAGGSGRGVMPFARAQLAALGWEVVFLETHPGNADVNGVPLWSEQAFFDAPCRERAFAVSIADSRARQSIALRCERRGARPMTLQAPDVIVYDGSTIGDGSILCARTVVTSNVRVGRHVHVNLFSYIEHDCVLGDWVTLAPRVSCNGRVHIGEHAYIGSAAVIKPGRPDGPVRRIAAGAVVGMGAVVTRDVMPNQIVVGNPARPIHRPVAG